MKIEDKVITTIYIRRDLKELAKKQIPSLSEAINEWLERYLLYPKNLPRNLEEESQKLFAELERMRDNIKQAKEELESLKKYVGEVNHFVSNRLDGLSQNFADLLEKILAMNEKVSQLVELKTVEREEEKTEIEASEEWEILKQRYLTRRQSGIPETFDLEWISSPAHRKLLQKLKMTPKEALERLREETKDTNFLLSSPQHRSDKIVQPLHQKNHNDQQSQE